MSITKQQKLQLHSIRNRGQFESVSPTAHFGGDVDNLPDYFVTALEMSATDHMAMSGAVQPS